MPKTLPEVVFSLFQIVISRVYLCPKRNPQQRRTVPSDFMAANNPSIAFEKEQIFGMAEKEMEYRVDMFNKLTQTCFSKCIENRHKESELNMGENSCIDRCVSKYWQVTNLVGQLLGNQPPM